MFAFRRGGLTSSSNGVDCWAKNEEMVDWIAIQYPKIKKVFKQLNINKEVESGKTIINLKELSIQSQ